MITRDDMRQVLRLVESAARDVERRVMSRVQGGVTIAFVKGVSDGAKMQSVNAALADDESGDFEHYQPGGVSHRPGAGAEGVALTVGGERAKIVVVSISRRGVRVKASMPGGSVLYAEVGSGADVEIMPDGDGAMKVGPNPEQSMVQGDKQAAWFAGEFFVATPFGPAAVLPATITAITNGTNAWKSKHKLDA